VYSYPRTRLRRNRKAQWSRDLISETTLSPADLIMPLFVVEGNEIQAEIQSMPGVFRYSIDKLIDKVKILSDKGICAVMLFPFIKQDLKTPYGDEALNQNNLICRAVQKIKQSVPNIGVIVDVALDPYTSHGFDGVLDDKGDVDNDKTIEILCKQALLLADAGVDAVGPSDMMDGRIGAIRDALEKHKHYKTQIFAYSVKYASNFYNPFRDAIGSKGNLGNRDKKTYFCDYRNSKEAILEIELDILEGADTVIIKPGLMYLDIISKASTEFKVPVIGYQVSGEYALLKNAAEQKIINEKEAVTEIIYAFKRAGASSIISYYADRIIDWI
jgi:porphobilinogen synthase